MTWDFKNIDLNDWDLNLLKSSNWTYIFIFRIVRFLQPRNLVHIQAMRKKRKIQIFISHKFGRFLALFKQFHHMFLYILDSDKNIFHKQYQYYYKLPHQSKGTFSTGTKIFGIFLLTSLCSADSFLRDDYRTKWTIYCWLISPI